MHSYKQSGDHFIFTVVHDVFNAYCTVRVEIITEQNDRSFNRMKNSNIGMSVAAENTENLTF